VTAIPSETCVKWPRKGFFPPSPSQDAVARTSTKKLKIYTEQPPRPERPQIEALGCLPEVLRAFRTVTGWSLRYIAGPESKPTPELPWSAPVNPGVGASPGHLRLESTDSEPALQNTRRPKAEGSKRKDERRETGRPKTSHRGAGNSLPADAPASPPARPSAQTPVRFEAARSLASSITDMVNELMQTRHALWQREAELAAGVPLVPHAEEEQHLAARLEAVLRGGAQAVDCQAAALFMLDDATTHLKLRSSWGLPFDRLTAPARPLKGSIADLEALLGHAVVLNDPELIRSWAMPEDFPSAVCVPVSTPTMLLGTLWVFCDRKREFNDRQTNMLEVVAGRLAADLEREMLLREGLDAAQWKRQLAAAERLQRNQLPSLSPLLDGWQLSGWTVQSQAIGGDFHDWFCLPNGLLAVAVGDSAGRGIEAAMAATALKAEVRAHGGYHREAQKAVKQINLTLWTGSAGDQFATLFYGLIETATGRISTAAAGNLSVLLVRPNGCESLSHHAPPLGESPETEYEQFGYELQPGEALAIFTAGLRDARDGRNQPLGEAGIGEVLVENLHLTADLMAALVRDRCDAGATGPEGEDRTLLVIKRTHA
jgi:phosphoserine phosphatase RsbU/P